MALRLRPLIVLLVFFLGETPAEEGVAWRHFERAAFDEAREAGKPLIVNVGHEGCTACRTMERGAFSDPRVIALMNDAFVPIQVDSEMEPDIGERYSDWAWPATAFLEPDGTQVFAIAGSRRADDFLALLRQVVARHRAGELKTDDLAPYGAPSAPREGPLADMEAQVRSQLLRGYDDVQGGWGRVKVLETAAPISYLFARGQLLGDVQASSRAKQTAAGFLAQLDTEWGGMFYASFDRFGNIVPEKRLESQAAALMVFADALQVTGEARYRDALDSVHDYLETWLVAPDGTWYANHKDDGIDLPPGMDMAAYYALTDAERRAVGLPAIDRAVYTDVNARVIIGLARAFEVTGERRYLVAALRAAETLAATRRTNAGWMVQFVDGQTASGVPRVHAVRETGLPYLRAQAWFGLAALALYQAGDDMGWLDVALSVTHAMREHLEDAELGGFFAAPAREVDGIVGRRKPLEDNAVAARLLFRLGVLTREPAFKTAAERAIRASAAPAIVRREGRITGELANTLLLLRRNYVEFSVVGSGPQAERLMAAARAVYEPRGLRHFEAPGRYPPREEAALYICNDARCTVPITSSAEVLRHALSFRPLAAGSGNR